MGTGVAFEKKTTNARYLSQWESDRKTTAHTHTQINICTLIISMIFVLD